MNTLLIALSLALLLGLVVWIARPQPWELWERTATPAEIDARIALYHRCTAAIPTTGTTRAGADRLKAEITTCIANLPVLKWEFRERFAKNAGCLKERNKRVADHRTERDVYDCLYQEKNNRWQLIRKGD